MTTPHRYRPTLLPGPRRPGHGRPRHRRPGVAALAVVVTVSLAAAACGSGSSPDTGAADTGAAAASSTTTTTTAPTTEAPTTTAAPTTTEAPYSVLRVPEDHPTIQEAVDAAEPGDLVLVAPGVYEESVAVETDDIVIRGLDRNEVVLDGGHELENGIIVFSNGVAVENLTTRNYTSNGVFFTGDYDSDFVLTGYRASYVTAYDNGLYGIYAFNARYGQIDHSYGSGHPDSAFYVGQCQPCDAVLTDLLAENNTLGYSGTNSGGDLYVVNSEWRDNRIGVVPNTLDSEELAPQRGATFAGNWIHDNGNPDTPLRNEVWDLAFGIGIVVAGGRDDLVTRNLVTDNVNGGIAVSLFFDEQVWLAEDNRVLDNVVSGSLYDLLLVVPDPDAGAGGNCFAGNTFATSLPADIETVAACDGGDGPLGELLAIGSLPTPDTPPVDYTTIAAPGPQPTMADADTAPPSPADVLPLVDEFLADDFDITSIEVPTPEPATS